MGACDFRTFGQGKTAQAAFNSLVDQARWEHSHGGYTGTIAEKHSFIMIGGQPGDPKVDAKAPIKVRTEEARNAAVRLMDARDLRIDDKWGPAGCLDCGPGDQAGERLYLFFGLASS